jgi:hypothetical protein
MLSRSTKVTLTTLLAAGFAATLATGCTTSRDQAIRNSVTPELETLYQRKVDQDNAGALTFSENGRMFWEDMGRAFYTDRPSRLTREPIPRP